jgi:hypothetical protein
MFDEIFEGHNTTGEIETMVELNGYWLNYTQRRYETEGEAIEDHKQIVKMIMEGKIKEIAGNSFGTSFEDKEKVDELLKV